ncbi:MAG: SDR family NAD(P)-dependent oxidoreductase [Bacteroidales bacterium]|nr:SDR family NAD(P)-dependent oxidoreductase [Bacteroidales bacterium]
MTNHYTVILGAEGKLGRALAREVAGRGCNLILISISKIDLQRFAIGLQLGKNVDVQAYKLNLGNRDDIMKLISDIKSHFKIRALINNIICEWSDEKKDCVCIPHELDYGKRFQSLAMITWLLLPELVRWPVAYIQNVVPVPYRTKESSPANSETISEMYAFSKELDEELKDTGVIVSVLHPTHVKTRQEFQLLDDPYVFNPMIAMVPRKIAEQAIRGMLAGERLIIPGFWNRLSFFLNRDTSFWFRLPLRRIIPRDEILNMGKGTSLQTSG